MSLLSLVSGVFFNDTQHIFLEYTPGGGVVLCTILFENISFLSAQTAGKGAHMLSVPLDIVAAVNFLLVFFGDHNNTSFRSASVSGIPDRLLTFLISVSVYIVADMHTIVNSGILQIFNYNFVTLFQSFSPYTRR